MSKVTNISEKSKDNRQWSVEQMLEKTLEEIRAGELRFEANKAVLILLPEDMHDYAPIQYFVNIDAVQRLAAYQICIGQEITNNFTPVDN